MENEFYKIGKCKKVHSRTLVAYSNKLLFLKDSDNKISHEFEWNFNLKFEILHENKEEINSSLIKIMGIIFHFD